MIQDPASISVKEVLASPAFEVGILRGQWKLETFNFPVLMIWVNGTEPDLTRKWYRFKLELSNYPNQNPAGFLWHPTEDRSMPDEDRPKLRNRSPNDSFKNYHFVVYRPWERTAASHLNKTPWLNWGPDKDLIFVLKDLYERLNANALVSVFDEGAQNSL
jgi:hypothetical protein